MGRNLLRAGWLAVLPALMVASAAPDDETTPAKSFFVVVHIPEGLNPLERSAKYEYPLADSLKERGLGDVSGGGSQLGPRKPNGTHDTLTVDIDVDLVDAERGLPALRAALRKLNPPPGTQLSYTGPDGSHVQEPL